MASIRMLAVDVDGTLAASRHEVSPKTRDAMHRLVAGGIELCIATGRRPRTTGWIVESLGLPVPVVCLGGALLKDSGGQPLHSQVTDPATLGEITQMARLHGQAVVGQRDASLAGGPDFVLDEGVAWNSATATYFDNNEEYAARRDLSADPVDDVLMTGVFGEKSALHGLAAAVHQRWPGRFLTNVVSQPNPEWGDYCEIAPAGVSKWSALQRLAAHLAVDEAAVCAVGDEVNDLAMIRGAGMGVAMGNANEAVKQEADWVCGRHDEDGLVAVVERLLAG